MCLSEPPSVPYIRALRDNQTVTEVNEGEILDVECTVDRVYPDDGLEFQLMSGAFAVTSRLSGRIAFTNSGGTFSATKIFSNLLFLRSYSATEDGLTCRVYHPRGNNVSQPSAVIVMGEYRLWCHVFFCDISTAIAPLSLILHQQNVPMTLVSRYMYM